MSYLDIADRSWPVTRRVMGLHAFIYRVTRGALGRRVGLGLPILLLDHTGAKSGKRRTSALMYVPDGDRPVVVASKGGFPQHPAWYHNLIANPETTIQIGSERRAVRARVATGAERNRLWARAVESFGPYATYQSRAGREIPLIVLDPVEPLDS